MGFPHPFGYRSKSGASSASFVGWCHCLLYHIPYSTTPADASSAAGRDDARPRTMTNFISQRGIVLIIYKVATGSSRWDKERSKPVCDQKSTSATASPSCRPLTWQDSHHLCSAEGEMPGLKASMSCANSENEDGDCIRECGLELPRDIATVSAVASPAEEQQHIQCL